MLTFNMVIFHCCVFFFKQKTAYELRISDWSSDVCSSDLTFAVKLAGLLSRQDGFVENTGPGGDFGGHKEWAAHIDARWLAADWLTADYSYDRSHLQYYNYQFQGVIPRSEEHTSELQSLMRISYAVFCLKKQQKKSPQTKTANNLNQKQKDP